ncbi:MAG: PadR family transcriptional regulator [Actinomycetota bacterium]|nr:PadR family transcriptional regulator [Actinomycetota bacterium]
MDTYASWMAQLRKGVVELFVLGLLRSRGDLHGYGIVQELAELGEVVAGMSTVYPILKRLEGDGLVAARWDTEGGGNPRKYYAITPEGIAFLKAARREWDALDSAMRALEGEQR